MNRLLPGWDALIHLMIFIRNLLNHLSSRYPNQIFPRTIGKNGQLVDYGNLLDPKSYLATNIPNLHDPFNEYHIRRNKLPTSHAKDKKTQLPSEPLKRSERNYYVNRLMQGYSELANFLSQHGF